MTVERTPEEIAAELSEVNDAITRQETGEDPPVIQTPELSDVERVASRYGWVPKEKYRGDASHWKPAEQFMDDGLKFNKNIKKELDGLKGQYNELHRTGQAFAKFHEEAMARKDQEIKEAITETRRQIRTAIREGDDTLAETLEARVELLQEERTNLKQAPQEPTPQRNAVNEDGSPNLANPVLEEWVQDGNEWFRDDAKLRAYAVELGQSMRAEGNTIQGRKFLDMVTERMREEFPRRFGKKEEPTGERRTDQVNGGGRSGAPQGYSVHDLPAADLKLMQEFIAKGWTTKEKFLSNYFSGEKRIHRTKS